MTNIQPIETQYNGYRFRSRTEARWAVFFDALGVPYEYEREGYTLPSGQYLPDFWLPRQRYWVEIKGRWPTDLEQQLGTELRLSTRSPVFITVGSPEAPTNHPENGSVTLTEWPDWDGSHFWTYCPGCGSKYLVWIATTRAELPCDCFPADEPEERWLDFTGGDIGRAYEAARSARFEHGENGPPKPRRTITIPVEPPRRVEVSEDVPVSVVNELPESFLRDLWLTARRANPRVAAYINGSCKVATWESPMLILGMYRSHKFCMDKILEPNARRIFEEAAAVVLGVPVKLAATIIDAS